MKRIAIFVFACACGTPGVTGDAGADAASEATASDAGGTCGNLPPATLVDHARTPLAIAGEPDGGTMLGIYDPSVVYPVGAPGGVLSYSAVSPNDVHTRIATSTDHGASFTWVAEPNVTTSTTIATTDTTVCGAASCTAVLWHEVSSIIADPTDVASRAFKLFVHTYASLANGSNLRRDWGYVGLQTAPAPDGPWSSETPLLGWKSSAPISSNVTQVLTDTPALADCVLFTEPAAIVTPLGLDLALACFSLPNGHVSQRIVLLRSTDHAASFSYVSTVLAPADEACLGSSTSAVNGADLFVVGGREYLLVTPVAPILGGTTDYAGCVTIPIADVGGGTVARTDAGAPEVVRYLAADDGRFTGPCTYAEGATSSGYFVPMYAKAPPLPAFRILTTGVTAP